MKNSLVTLGLALAMLVPAMAEATIDDLQVRRVGSHLNVRVTVRNPGKVAQEGPIKIDLEARATSEDPWTSIKTWADVKSMPPSYRVARDFFDENSPFLTELAAGGKFQVRATVVAPGVTKTVEKTSWYNSKTDY